jgi:hypothetical protein
MIGAADANLRVMAGPTSTTNGLKLGMIQGQAPSAVMGLTLWQLWANEASKSRHLLGIA